MNIEDSTKILDQYFDYTEVDLDTIMTLDETEEFNFEYYNLIFSVTDDFNDIDIDSKKVIIQKVGYDGYIELDKNLIQKLTWSTDLKKWTYFEPDFVIEFTESEKLALTSFIEAYFDKNMSVEDSLNWMSDNAV